MGSFKKRRNDDSEDENHSSSDDIAVPSDSVVSNLQESESKKLIQVPQSASDGGFYFELSNNRRVSLRTWQNKVLLDIREYYTDAAGELKPGKKGISLSMDQYQSFIKLLPSIDAQLQIMNKK